MSQNSLGLREQAVNKIVEVAISSQLKQPADVTAHITTDLNKLARGQLEAIAITIRPLLMPQNLEAEEFHLNIGQVTVKPLKALTGKIHLVHPSEGTLYFVVNEASFTAALNTESLNNTLRSQHPSQAGVNIVRCALSDNTITLFIEFTPTGTTTPQAGVLAITPQISPDEREVIFSQAHCVEGDEPAPNVIAVLLTRLRELLSLQGFEQKGMAFKIQRIDVSSGKFGLNATAQIEQFPSA